MSIIKSININVTNAIKNENNYFTVKKYTFNNNEYNIIKYNKEILKSIDKDNNFEEFQNIAKFRSVITRNNKVVCYAPDKSVDYKYFTKHYTPKNSWVEDFIDGTMINVFYDNIKETWEIATRTSVGGNIVFFNDVKNYKFFDNHNFFKEYYNLTFRSMFFEACNSNNFNLNNLDKNYTYSFVLQHPFNRIVTPIVSPLIYLVKIYKIEHPYGDVLSSNNLNEVLIHEVNIPEFVNNPPYVFLNTNIKFINKYPINTFEEIYEYYSGGNSPYYCLGCVLYSKEGIRSKIRNVNYENVRKLRGNQPKLQFNYLSLKKQNKIAEFLQYYPEHTLMFNKFKDSLFKYTDNLYHNYLNCYIRKEKPLKEYDFEFKTHMYKLHEKYKNELKINNKKIDKKFVIDYVNSLLPAQQMFLINYKNNTTLRKKTTDCNNDILDNSTPDNMDIVSSTEVLVE